MAENLRKGWVTPRLEKQAAQMRINAGRASGRSTRKPVTQQQRRKAVVGRARRVKIDSQGWIMITRDLATMEPTSILICGGVRSGSVVIDLAPGMGAMLSAALSTEAAPDIGSLPVFSPVVAS